MTPRGGRLPRWCVAQPWCEMSACRVIPSRGWFCDRLVGMVLIFLVVQPWISRNVHNRITNPYFLPVEFVMMVPWVDQIEHATVQGSREAGRTTVHEKVDFSAQFLHDRKMLKIRNFGELCSV